MLLQKLDLRGNPLSRMIDRLNTRWLRMSPKVACGALAYARLHGADRIFCGHTHDAMHQEKDGVHYYNAGGWIDSHLTYITVAEEGVRIHEYVDRDDEDEDQQRGEPDKAVVEPSEESELLEFIEYEDVTT